MSIPLRAIDAWAADVILYYRILASLVVIWLFIGLFRRKQWRADQRYLRAISRPERHKLVLLTVLASLFIMGNWFTFIYAVNHISVQSAAFAYMVCPLLTTVGAYFILKEELTRIKKVALGIALISVLMLAQGSLVEVIWSLSMALLYAMYLITQRVIRNVDKLNVLAVQITICSILIAPVLLTGQYPAPSDGVFWTNIIVIATLFTVVPLYLSLYALNGIPSSTVGILIYVNPIFGFAVAILYFGESVDAFKIVAYGILVAAVIIFNWEILRKMLRR